MNNWTKYEIFVAVIGYLIGIFIGSYLAAQLAQWMFS